MKALLRNALALVAALLAGHASAEVTFYEHENFGGRAFTAQEPVENFKYLGFNDRASSVVVTGEDWEVCDDVGFSGRCMVLRPGTYPSLRAMDMNDRLSSAGAVGREHHHDRRYAPMPMPGEIVFYEHDGFRGRMSPPRAMSPTSRTSASTTAPRRSSCWASAGRPANTQSSPSRMPEPNRMVLLRAPPSRPSLRVSNGTRSDAIPAISKPCCAGPLWMPHSRR